MDDQTVRYTLPHAQDRLYAPQKDCSRYIQDTIKRLLNSSLLPFHDHWREGGREERRICIIPLSARKKRKGRSTEAKMHSKKDAKQQKKVFFNLLSFSLFSIAVARRKGWMGFLERRRKRGHLVRGGGG